MKGCVGPRRREEVRRLRDEGGLTFSQIADRLDITPGYASMLYGGKRGIIKEERVRWGRAEQEDLRRAAAGGDRSIREIARTMNLA